MRVIKLDIDENSFPTLVEHHKDLFIEEHWKRVLLFEWHFYMLYGNEYEYDELVQKKNEYFDALQNSVRVADRIHENAKATIKRRLARRQLRLW